MMKILGKNSRESMVNKCSRLGQVLSNHCKYDKCIMFMKKIFKSMTKPFCERKVQLSLLKEKPVFAKLPSYYII